MPKNIFHRHKKNYLVPYSAILLAFIIWSGALPTIKITTQYLGPFTFLLFRFLLVCTLMLPVMYVMLKKNPIDRRDIKNLVLLGISGQSVLAIIFLGIKYTTALDAAIIGTLGPLLTIAAGHYFYKDRINNITKLGIFIATAGMFYIVLEPLFSQTYSGVPTSLPLRFFGNALITLYTLAFSMYIVWSKMVMGKKSPNLDSFFRHFHVRPMKKKYSPIVHTSFAFYIGLATTIPLAVLENLGVFGKQPSLLDAFQVTPILGVLYMAIFSSIVAYIAFEWGLKQAHVSDGAILGYLGPLFTLPFAFVLLGETPSKTNIIGGMIIAVGVIIAEKNKS